MKRLFALPRLVPDACAPRALARDATSRLRRRVLVSVTLSAAATGAIPAQAQDASPEQALRDLSEALKAAAAEATADTTQSKPGRLRFTYELDRRGECRVRLTQRSRVWKAESKLVSDADLSLLSPEVNTWTDPNEGMVIVTAWTTSGRVEIPERWQDDDEQRRDAVRFRGWHRDAAERIARPLAAAITACGGRPQDAAAKALIARRVDSVSAAARAQVAADADTVRVLQARVPGPGRWVLDSSPPVKNRRQGWWAAVAASDTLVGRYRATRPVLQLYCASDRERIGLVVLLGQPAELKVNVEKRGGKQYLVNRAAVSLGRDDQPTRVTGWLHDHEKHRILPDEGKRLDEALADLTAARRYRLGVRLLDMKETSWAVFELDGVAERMAWLREHCGATPG